MEEREKYKNLCFINKILRFFIFFIIESNANLDDVEAEMNIQKEAYFNNVLFNHVLLCFVF